MKSQKDRLVAKIEEKMANLPNQKILARYQNAHANLIDEFFRLRYQSILLGKSLKARFGGGGGNPCDAPLQQGLIDRYQYELILGLTDVYRSIFDLIQTNWSAIKPTMLILEDGCNSESELFFAILAEHYDMRLMGCKDGYSLTPTHAKNTAAKLRKKTSQLIIDILADELPVDRKKCGSISNRKHFWLPLALSIAKENLKSNPSLHSYYRNCWKELSRFANIHERWASQHRSDRASAVRWKNGELAIGVPGGYKPVTELYETFSEFPLIEPNC